MVVEDGAVRLGSTTSVANDKIAVGVLDGIKNTGRTPSKAVDNLVASKIRAMTGSGEGESRQKGGWSIYKYYFAAAGWPSTVIFVALSCWTAFFFNFPSKCMRPQISQYSANEPSCLAKVVVRVDSGRHRSSSGHVPWYIFPFVVPRRSRSYFGYMVSPLWQAAKY